MHKPFFSGNKGKIYTLGIFLICGLLLSSVDDCESLYLAELEAQAAIEGRSPGSQGSGSGSSQSSLATAGSQAGSQGQSASTSSTKSSQQAAAASSSGQSGTAQAGGAASTGTGAASDGTASTGTGNASSGTASTGAGTSSQGTGGGASTGTEIDYDDVYRRYAAAGKAGIDSTGAGNTSTSEGTAKFDPSAGSSGANYLTSISGKEWKLSELHLSGRTVRLDRTKLKAEGMDDVFTMTVDNTRISGKAAPNRYTTVYHAETNNMLTLMPVVSTLMATSSDP